MSSNKLVSIIHARGKMTNCVVILLLVGLCFVFTEAGCIHGGETIAEGASFELNCNTCVCVKEDTIACTENSCNPKHSPSQRDLSAGTCKVNGKSYENGEVFKKLCETCVCLSRGPACYKSGCRS